MKSHKSLLSVNISSKTPMRLGNELFRRSSTGLNSSVGNCSFTKEIRFKDSRSSTQNASLPNLGSTLTKQSVSFTRSGKSSDYKVEGPGPSTYDIKSLFDGSEHRRGALFKSSTDSRDVLYI